MKVMYGRLLEPASGVFGHSNRSNCSNTRRDAPTLLTKLKHFHPTTNNDENEQCENQEKPEGMLPTAVLTTTADLPIVEW